MAGEGRNSVNFIKQKVPKFIQDFKAKTNQVEAPGIEAKRKTTHSDDEDVDREDEAPLVCLTNDGVVSKDEVETFMKESYGENYSLDSNESDNKRRHSDEEEDNKHGGKMVFKKPTKTTKPKSTDTRSTVKVKSKLKNDQPKSKMKQIKNSKLLSFADDEEDED